jgi:hypothetical protein
MNEKIYKTLLGQKLSIQTLLFVIYFSLAPVYWLPGINFHILSLIKFFLFVTAVVVSVLKLILSDKFYFPKGMGGVLGLLALLLSATSAFCQANTIDTIVKKIFSYSIGFIILWVFYNLQRKNGNNLKLYKLLVIPIAILSAITVFDYILQFNLLSPPIEFYEKGVGTSGFGASRTGWSNGISYYAAFSLCFSISSYRKVSTMFFSLAFLSIFTSQIISGGRAGMLISLFSALLCLLYYKKVKLALMMVTLLISIVCFTNIDDNLGGLFRLNRLQSNYSFISTADAYSTGRISSYLYAIKLASKKPFMGYGFGNKILRFENVYEIHNVWLKMLIEGGVFLPLIFIFFILHIVFKKKHDKSYFILTNGNNFTVFTLYTIVFVGLLTTLFEPNALIGSFQISAIWWASVGSLLGLCEFLRKNKSDFQLSESQHPLQNRRIGL